ncbi:hypothetical protein EON65_58660 [archaeon]|nr:MAG: hypothetical protein EON65_58660 [archaeon]
MKQEKCRSPASWHRACEMLQFDLSLEDQQKIASLQVPLPPNEKKRMKILRQSFILDTPEEAVFDRYTSLAARHFKVT